MFRPAVRLLQLCCQAISTGSVRIVNGTARNGTVSEVWGVCGWQVVVVVVKEWPAGTADVTRHRSTISWQRTV
jgi:hypothetical protein